MIDALKLAKFMFERNAREYTDDTQAIEEMWQTDPGVREFWSNEANAVLGFLGFAKAGV